jgi:NADH-quinone oxidoreductase subunit L
MRKMGGLWKRMPITAWTYLIACLAISGIPTFAGFFSKDEILWKSFSSHNLLVSGHWIWLAGALAATLTAFYMFRSFFMTFTGVNRADEQTKAHIKESPYSMTWVLIVLAALSALGGFLGVPYLIGHHFHFANHLEHWLTPMFIASEESLKWNTTLGHGVEWGLMGASTAVALIGIGSAYWLYHGARNPLPERLRLSFSGVWMILYNKYYIDEIYEAFIIKPIHGLSIILWRVVDVIFIDGAMVNGSAWTTRVFAGLVRTWQNGNIHRYAMSMVLGAALLMAYLLLGLKGE